MHAVILFFSLIILILSVGHLGESVYTFIESQERKDEFGKELKNIALHQIISSGIAAFFALIGLGLWHSNSVKSGAYLGLGILSFLLSIYFIVINEAGFNKLKAYKEDMGTTEERKIFNKRAKNIYITNYIIMGLLVLFAIVCGISWRKYKSSSSDDYQPDNAFGRKKSRKSKKMGKSRNRKSRSRRTYKK